VGTTPQTFAGRFVVLGQLGRGGMATVLRARDVASGREVALKLADVVTDEPQRLERFRREGQIAASLRHPGIVGVHSAGDAGGRPWIAFELVEGARAIDAVARELDAPRRVALVRDAARALGHAHARGVVHRDVKPENLLVDREGRVRVADFGVALMGGQDRLTRTGAAVGTPSYMAPEQVAGERGDVGPWTDVWGLGVVLHEVLTGELPFPARSAGELVAAICSRDVPPPSRRGAPRGLDPIVAVALAKAPGARYPDADALARDLDAWLGGTPVSAVAPARARDRRTIAAASAVGGVVALTIVAAVFALRPLPPPAAPAPPRGVDQGAVVAAPSTRDAARGASWFDALPVEARPPLPLPAGLRLGEAPGEYVNRTDGSVLVWVPAATFTMGRDDREPSEAPAHQVTLTRGYFLGKDEVTWDQWRRFCAARSVTLRTPAWRFTPECAVTGVKWDEAVEYCAWAGLRLPTEAEWELAARGADGRTFPWGETPPTLDHAHFGAPTGPDRVGVRPLGTSPSGCRDMAGNAIEWCSDIMGAYTAGPAVDPRGPVTGDERVTRGGGWGQIDGARLSTTARSSCAPDVLEKLWDVGLRVAR
jgi:serine/threonine-protein kinase